MDRMPLTEARPGVRSGKRCFVGTRITVADIVEYLASGMTVDEVLADFPDLTVEQVRLAVDTLGSR